MSGQNQEEYQKYVSRIKRKWQITAGIQLSFYIQLYSIQLDSTKDSTPRIKSSNLFKIQSSTDDVRFGTEFLIKVTIKQIISFFSTPKR